MPPNSGPMISRHPVPVCKYIHRFQFPSRSNSLQSFFRVDGAAPTNRPVNVIYPRVTRSLVQLASFRSKF